jgi:argininosuccinate lyase
VCFVCALCMLRAMLVHSKGPASQCALFTMCKVLLADRAMSARWLATGALAGNPFGVDRQFIARELGFVGGVCPNSMDAVSDRDYVLDTLYFVAVHMTHLSRWAEDLIIYSSGLFKFVQCSDAYATGGHMV